jgi:hypothetical protein
LTKCRAASLSRLPTYQDGISLVSASIAVQVQVARALRGGLGGRDVLLLGVDEAPDLVELKPLAVQVP